MAQTCLESEGRTLCHKGTKEHCQVNAPQLPDGRGALHHQKMSGGCLLSKVQSRSNSETLNHCQEGSHVTNLKHLLMSRKDDLSEC